MSCENNDLTFASFCRALDAIISYHFTREIERHMQMIYGFGANCLEQLSALGNIFITVRPLRFVYRTISYAFYRLLFVFYSIVGHKSRVVNWIWNLVAVICILFITYSHFLTICCTLLLAACVAVGGEAISLSSGIILVFLDHFRMRTKVIRLHDDKYCPATAHSLFALPMGNKMIFALTYNRKLWQQKNNERQREREHKLKLKCLFTLRMNQ